MSTIYSKRAKKILSKKDGEGEQPEAAVEEDYMESVNVPMPKKKEKESVRQGFAEGVEGASEQVEQEHETIEQASQVADDKGKAVSYDSPFMFLVTKVNEYSTGILYQEAPPTPHQLIELMKMAISVAKDPPAEIKDDKVKLKKYVLGLKEFVYYLGEATHAYVNYIVSNSVRTREFYIAWYFAIMQLRRNRIHRRYVSNIPAPDEIGEIDEELVPEGVNIPLNNDLRLDYGFGPGDLKLSFIRYSPEAVNNVEDDVADIISRFNNSEQIKRKQEDWARAHGEIVTGRG